MTVFPCSISYHTEQGDIHFDQNAIFGFDKFNDTWFIKAFEFADEAGTLDYRLYFGSSPNEFSSLEHILMSLKANGVNLFVRDFIDLFGFFPSSKTLQFKILYKHLDIFAFINESFNKELLLNPSLDYATYLKSYTQQINDSTHYIKSLVKSGLPEGDNAILVEEIINSSLALYSDEPELAKAVKEFFDGVLENS